jgi:DNA-binding transcriptional MerR regulator
VPDFDINELSERADVTPRTVHFYVQQGLLPPAGSPGPGARYTEGHVSRLRLIRLLQKQHLPLAEIAKRLKGLKDDQVALLLAESKLRRSLSGGSALEYIRGVLSEPRASAGETADRRGTTTRVARAVRAGEALLASTPAAPERSQWERFTLADGLELHVRRPMTRVEQRQFEKLMAAARTIFSESERED